MLFTVIELAIKPLLRDCVPGNKYPDSLLCHTVDFHYFGCRYPICKVGEGVVKSSFPEIRIHPAFGYQCPCTCFLGRYVLRIDNLSYPMPEQTVFLRNLVNSVPFIYWLAFPGCQHFIRFYLIEQGFYVLFAY